MDDQDQLTTTGNILLVLTGIALFSLILIHYLPDGRLSDALQIVIEIEILAAGIYLLLKKSMT
jgi:hypothetical protein